MATAPHRTACHCDCDIGRRLSGCRWPHRLLPAERSRVIFGCCRNPSPAAEVSAVQYQHQTRCASASQRQHRSSRRPAPSSTPVHSRFAVSQPASSPPHIPSPEPSPAVRPPRMLVVKFHWTRTPSVFTCACGFVHAVRFVIQTQWLWPFPSSWPSRRGRCPETRASSSFRRDIGRAAG